VYNCHYGNAPHFIACCGFAAAIVGVNRRPERLVHEKSKKNIQDAEEHRAEVVLLSG